MNKEDLTKELNKLLVKVTENELNKLEIYKDLIKEYNQKFNLTSIKEDNEIYLKHFYDSLYLLSLKEIQSAKNILDIGTGAGFPGIPLAIFLKNTQITLIESNTKKCTFLKIVKEKLNLNNITIINERAETFAKNNKEKFDIATSRAVAHLKILSELEIPTLKINGMFLPLKSSYEEELNNSKEIITLMGAEVIDIINYTLPYENSKRTIIKIQKTKPTPHKYPRNYSIILKSTK